MSAIIARPFHEPQELPVSGSLTLARRLSFVAAAAACVAAVLGLAYGEQWLYQSDALTLGQVYGHDMVVLLVVVPMLLASIRTARRGSARGLVTWAGSLLYLAYWYHFMLDGIDFGRVYLLHLVLVGSSLSSLAVLAARLDAERFAHRVTHHLPARSLGAFVAVMGSVFATAAIIDIVQRLRYHEAIDTASRGIYTVDLTIMLPLTVVAGILLWRHETWGYILTGPLLVNAALSAATLFAASLALHGSMGSSIVVMYGLGLGTALLSAFSLIFIRGVRV